MVKDYIVTFFNRKNGCKMTRPRRTISPVASPRASSLSAPSLTSGRVGSLAAPDNYEPAQGIFAGDFL